MTTPTPPRDEPERPVPTAPEAKHGVRPRSVLVACLALCLLAYGAWAYFRPFSAGPPNTDGVRSVRVWNDPEADGRGRAPDADTNDPDAVAALLDVVRSARETEDHKCGNRGVILLQRSTGPSERLEFLPGHSPDWYEFRYDRNIYRVPRDKFIAALKRLGVAVPLDC